MEKLEMPGGTYTGEVEDGVPNGHGTFSAKDGGSYVGNHLNGVPSGHGVMLRGDIRYEGEFSEGNFHGWGTLTYVAGENTGDSYTGDFENAQFSGMGRYTWADGSYCWGRWLEGKAHGLAEQELANGERYQGQFERDMPHGLGVYTWPNGDRYEGEFQDHKRHGQAVFLPGGDFKGDKFEGEYRNDEMYKGVYYDSKRNRERRIEPKKGLLKSLLGSSSATDNDSTSSKSKRTGYVFFNGDFWPVYYEPDQSYIAMALFMPKIQNEAIDLTEDTASVWYAQLTALARNHYSGPVYSRLHYLTSLGRERSIERFGIVPDIPISAYMTQVLRDEEDETVFVYEAVVDLIAGGSIEGIHRRLDLDMTFSSRDLPQRLEKAGVEELAGHLDRLCEVGFLEQLEDDLYQHAKSAIDICLSMSHASNLAHFCYEAELETFRVSNVVTAAEEESKKVCFLEQEDETSCPICSNLPAEKYCVDPSEDLIHFHYRCGREAVVERS